MIKNFLGLMLIVFGISLASVSAQTESNVKGLSKGVLNGAAISLPKPPYPPAAKAVRASGAVNIQVVVDENGNVISATAVSGHPLLRNVSERAARSAKFNPTVLGGAPVKVIGVLVYNFPATAVNNSDVPERSDSKSTVPKQFTVNGSESSVTGDKVLNGLATNLPKPAYPAAARAVKAQGAVSVQVLIDENGNVVTATAVSGHPLLRQSAVEAAQAANFKPTLLDGVPVKVNGIIVYNFAP